VFRRIGLVCTGNICRSPMAEALMRDRLQRAAIEIVSAGTGALVGHPADPLACTLMLERGLDIAAHRARQASRELVLGMDLILALDQTHSDWLARQFPELRGRIHKLLKWRKDQDVVDPYRQSRGTFERALADIELGVDDWVLRL